MKTIDCSKCEHCYYPNEICLYEFRWAAGAAGQEVDDINDVYFCQDFSDATEI